MEEKNFCSHKAGYKRKGQKYKSLLVWQILQKESDNEHPITVERIQEALRAYDIETDSRSIYRDIHDLQELFDKEYDLDDLAVDERNKLNYEISYSRKPIGDDGYGNKTSGYYVSQRPYTFEDLRLLAECINATRFISDRQAEGLREVLGSFCSSYEENRLLTEVDNVDRPKTPNKDVIYSVSTINNAIKDNKKIKFTYNKYTLENRSAQSARRRGSSYVASPFQVLITDGNYYAFCYDDHFHRIIPYRIDRMTAVSIKDEPREGHDKFAEIDIKTFTQRVFGMFQGKEYIVKMRFQTGLLDTVVDRFGAGGKGSNVIYASDDENHFFLTAPIEVSDQFFGWVSGFWKRAVILEPAEVVDRYKTFLYDIASKY